MSDDLSAAKEFAGKFMALVRVADVISKTEDADAAYADATKRLADVQSQLDAANASLSDAKAKADGVLLDAQKVVTTVTAAANAEAQRIVDAAHQAGAQIRATATDGAAGDLASIQRDIAENQSKLDRIMSDIADNVARRNASIAEADEASKALAAIKAELASAQAAPAAPAPSTAQ